ASGMRHQKGCTNIWLNISATNFKEEKISKCSNPYKMAMIAKKGIRSFFESIIFFSTNMLRKLATKTMERIAKVHPNNCKGPNSVSITVTTAKGMIITGVRVLK